MRLDALIARLNAWQPEMLVAYPSIARVLADSQLNGRLQIAPALVFTSSAVLTVGTRQRIEDPWGVKPFDQYGATDVMVGWSHDVLSPAFSKSSASTQHGFSHVHHPVSRDNTPMAHDVVTR